MILEYACIFTAMLCYLGYLCAAVGFCRRYLEISRTGEILFVILNVSGRILVDILCRFHFGWYGILISLDHVLFMGLVLWLFRGTRGKKILAASSLVAVYTLTVNFSSSFLSCLILFWKHTMQDAAEPVLGGGECCLIISISLVTVILAVDWSARHLGEVFCFVSGKGDMVLAIPLLAVTAVTDVANWGAGYGILFRSGGNMGLYYDQIFSYAGFCVLTALSMSAVGGYLSGMKHIWLEQEKSRQYRSQIAAYEMLEEQYTRSERLRHDLKNHVIALTGLLEKKEWKKMGSYLDSMADSADLRTGEEITGNRVVDILLYQKRKSAEEKHILWECDVQMPPNCCISEFDLCVLFGNILDNAVEACERLQQVGRHCDQPPFISVQAGSIRKCFLLEVKNSVSMAEKGQSPTADRITVKKNREGHGFGLLNVGDVVHKYNGVMNTEMREETFVTSVLVPLCDPDITSDASFETGI